MEQIRLPRGEPVQVAQSAERLTILSTDLSEGDVLDAGEYPMARIVFLVKSDAAIGLTAFPGISATTVRDGNQVGIQILGAAAFVEV